MSEHIKVTPSQLGATLEFCRAQGAPVMVWGPPGIGKSDIVQGTLARNFERTHAFFALLHDPTDIKGFGIPDRERGVMTFLRPDFLPRDGAPMGFFMDELPNAPPLVKNACLDLVLNPERYLPTGSYVVAAGNRPQDKTGAAALPSALNNRFTHVELVPSVADWSRWALESKQIAPVAIAYARFQPDAIEASPDLSQRAYCTPRALAKVGRMMQAGIPGEVESQVLCGTIGDMHGTQLLAFVQTWRRMPSLDRILADPTGADVPDGRDVLFALIHGLALRGSNDANFGAVVDYALRLPREFGLALVNDTIGLCPTLQSTADYVKFAVATQA